MTKKKDWQSRREISHLQYRKLLAALDLSRAAAARYLGISKRTSSRYWFGKAAVHPSHAMLLNGLVELGIAPTVPAWTVDQS